MKRCFNEIIDVLFGLKHRNFIRTIGYSEYPSSFTKENEFIDVFYIRITNSPISVNLVNVELNIKSWFLILPA